MSSRQEEKEARKRERMELEAKEASAAARAKRVQLVGGALLVAAIIAVGVLLLSSSGGDDGPGGGPDGVDVSNLPAIPKQQETDLKKAVAAAGCTTKTFPSEGREHLGSEETAFNDYKTNPPTSGSHAPTPAQDGVYDAGNSPTKESTVHSLEHGRINIQYRKGTPAKTIGQLERLYNESFSGSAEGYHQLVFENQTNMPFAVSATAWTQQLGCPKMNDKVFDAIRAFRTRYVDRAPEAVP